jgi:hypothetical protein
MRSTIRRLFPLGWRITSFQSVSGDDLRSIVRFLVIGMVCFAKRLRHGVAPENGDRRTATRRYDLNVEPDLLTGADRYGRSRMKSG